MGSQFLVREKGFHERQKVLRSLLNFLLPWAQGLVNAITAGFCIRRLSNGSGKGCHSRASAPTNNDVAADAVDDATYEIYTYAAENAAKVSDERACQPMGIGYMMAATCYNQHLCSSTTCGGHAACAEQLASTGCQGWNRSQVTSDSSTPRFGVEVPKICRRWLTLEDRFYLTITRLSPQIWSRYSTPTTMFSTSPTVLTWYCHSRFSST